MEEAIRQRVRTVLSEFNSNTNQLADNDVNFQNRLSRQINQGSRLSCDTIIRFLSAYPNVSAEWLIRGEGNMLITDNMPPFTGDESDNDLDVHAKVISLTLEKEELVKEINQLKDELKKKEGCIEWQKNYISDLIIENHNLHSKLGYENKKDIV